MFRSHVVIAGAVLALAAWPAHSQTPETITGTAQITSASGASSQAPFTLELERLATEAEQAPLLKAVKADGTEGARKILAGRAAVGTLQLGNDTTQVKYVSVRSLGNGRLITAITTDPISAASAGLAAPVRTSDLGLVLLQVSAAGKGTGELLTAGKVRVDENNEIITEASNAGTVVPLTDVVGR
jgi:hypothetical protein